eukprot:scaffold4955_cov53-Phaeocystis_antarctica.AAC.2
MSRVNATREVWPERRDARSPNAHAARGAPVVGARHAAQRASLRHPALGRRALVTRPTRCGAPGSARGIH